MFWKNLREVISNLPLMVCTTDNPKDISSNRFAFFVYLFMFVSIPVIVFWLVPYLAEKVLPWWQGIATLLGIQTGANLGRTVIQEVKAYKDAVKPPEPATIIVTPAVLNTQVQDIKEAKP